jgi:tripartite-type tricarboxylate transporter receptor subunit TctC
VTGTSRSPALPDVPTMQEAGLDGYSMETWWGIFGPADMPEDVVATLSTALEDIMSDPEVQERITRMGFEVRYSSPDEFTQFVVDENVRWAEIIEAQGLVGGGRM